MAKKSVISNRASNPALQFISQHQEEPAPVVQQAPAAEIPTLVSTEQSAPVVAPVQTQPQPTDDLDAMFTSYAVPDGYRLISKETRSHRLQLLLTPTLYDKVKQAATSHGLKVNDYIHRILDLATKDV